MPRAMPSPAARDTRAASPGSATNAARTSTIPASAQLPVRWRGDPQAASRLPSSRPDAGARASADRRPARAVAAPRRAGSDNPPGWRRTPRTGSPGRAPWAAGSGPEPAATSRESRQRRLQLADHAGGRARRDGRSAARCDPDTRTGPPGWRRRSPPPAQRHLRPCAVGRGSDRTPRPRLRARPAARSGGRWTRRGQSRSRAGSPSSSAERRSRLTTATSAGAVTGPRVQNSQLSPKRSSRASPQGDSMTRMPNNPATAPVRLARRSARTGSHSRPITSGKGAATASSRPAEP